MSISIFIIDTSYLLELFSVPGHSNIQSNKEIRKRFEIAIKNSCRLYVPLPCIYELANHIAHIDDGDIRKDIASKIYNTIQLSIREYFPWNITPSTSIDELPSMFEIFANEYVLQKISMTDTSIIQEAKRLKKEKYKVRVLEYIFGQKNVQSKLMNRIKNQIHSTDSLLFIYCPGMGPRTQTH